MANRTTWHVFAACLVLTMHGTAVHAQFDQLALRVPSTANALVAVNVRAAYASPLARAQGWKPDSLQAPQGGMITLPAQAEAFLMAAEIDFEFMQPHWEIAAAYVGHMPAMQEIATRCGGRLDRLAGAEAVERPNDSYVVPLGPKVIGAMSPANRQQVSRWLRDSRRRKSAELSPYLAAALVTAADPANPIVLALDLQGLLAAAEVADRLAGQDSIVGEQADLKNLSAVIASIRGLCLAVKLQSPAQGRLTIEFEQEAEALRGLAKPLLLHLMSKQGAVITDMQAWKVSVQGKSIALEGELSESGLRRVLSVLSSPVGPMAVRSPSSSAADQQMAAASQRYFQSVTNYLNDLFLNDNQLPSLDNVRQLPSLDNVRQLPSLTQSKLWVERYARKIDDLDTHQVDQDVIGFGQDVVGSLHEIVSVLDRSERRSDLRESTMYDSGRRRYGRYGAYGYYEKQYATRDRVVAQSEEASRSVEQEQEIVNELRQLSAQTRQTMTERYNRPF